MKKGFFVGRTTMDILYYHHGFLAENGKTKTMDYMTCIGGNACNAAITYALLGGEAVLITAVGDSSIGKSIKMELKDKYHIELIDLLEGQEISPFISSVLINVENESRTVWGGRQSLQSVREIDTEIILRQAAFIMTDNQFPEMSADLMRRARERRISSVFDAERWGAETGLLMEAATDVIASAECIPPDKSNLFEVMKEKEVLRRAVTDGGKNIRWEENEQAGTVAPLQMIPLDTLGAGDIFHGAYCYFRFDRKQDFEKALENASHVASYSIAFKGPRRGVLEYIRGEMTPASTGCE